MSFLKKLFGSKKKPTAERREPLMQRGGKPNAAAKAAAKSSVNLDETITAHDKYGREIQITKRDWLDSVLLGNLKKAANNPNELYGLITRGN